jgi:Kef-type K+ transport system membrane component KefB
MDADTVLASLLWTVLIAALAPVLQTVLRRPKLAPVVFMILGGILVGPEVLALAQPSDLEVLSDLGLGFLFLLAGYEVEPGRLGRREDRLAVSSWFTSGVLAVLVSLLLSATGVITSQMAIAIGLTTTALGTLIPILREARLFPGRFGSFVFSAGAAGEFFPIVAMAIFLSTRGAFFGLISLVLLGTGPLLLVKLIDLGMRAQWGRRLGLNENSTGQSTLRWTLVLLALLLVLSQNLGIDIVMGAFLAGMVLRYWSPGDVKSLEHKLDAVGYGVFIPIFFVVSGMSLDIDSIIAAPLTMLLFFLLLLAVRGLPSLWLYRRDLPLRARWQLCLFSATALPLLVALATVGTQTGVLSSADAAALIGAGVLSVVVFPTTALSLGNPDHASPAASADQEA